MTDEILICFLKLHKYIYKAKNNSHSYSQLTRPNRIGIKSHDLVVNLNF